MTLIYLPPCPSFPSPDNIATSGSSAMTFSSYTPHLSLLPLGDVDLASQHEEWPGASRDSLLSDTSLSPGLTPPPHLSVTAHTSKTDDLYAAGGCSIFIIVMFVLPSWRGIVAKVCASIRFSIPPLSGLYESRFDCSARRGACWSICQGCQGIYTDAGQQSGKVLTVFQEWTLCGGETRY